MNRPSKPHPTPQRSTVYDVDSACPRCGSFTLIGFSLYDTKGQFQHSHILCTTWADDAPVQHADSKNLWLETSMACGWHGWSHPDYRKKPYPDPECPPAPPVDLLRDQIILFLWDDGPRTEYALDSHLYDLGFSDEAIQEKKAEMAAAGEFWMESVHGNQMVGLPNS